MTTGIEFTAAGTPRAQGSKSLGHAKDGRAFMRESNDRLLRPWRKTIRAAAQQAMGDRPPVTGPVVVVVSFFLTRPKSHGLARTWPTAKNVGDLDKMLRAVLDACSTVVFVDDSQVVQDTSRKLWASAEHPEGVHVWVGRPSGYHPTDEPR